jgi:hypothetical protein
MMRTTWLCILAFLLLLLTGAHAAEQAKKETRIKSQNGEVSLSFPQGWQLQPRQSGDTPTMEVVLPQKARIIVTVKHLGTNQEADILRQQLDGVVKMVAKNPVPVSKTISGVEAKGVRRTDTESGLEVVRQYYSLVKDGSLYILTFIVTAKDYEKEKDSLESILSSLEIHAVPRGK